MYRAEVPQYDRLLSICKLVNEKALKAGHISPSAKEIKNLDVEYHGAIRVGTPFELSTFRRLFKVMGMHPVDYYDLSVAGIPVHSTAFRALSPEELLASPFRIFTSLLRLDLIADARLQQRAEEILSKRNIFSKQITGLIDAFEQQGGLNGSQAEEFVTESIEIFRWQHQANIDKQSYAELNSAHRLIADIVSFKGPHINHLTPKVLDIDEIHRQFSRQGFKAKDVIEGPPKRTCPILLRQTSFIALAEDVVFADGEHGQHTARFGEVEMRGIALTPKGRHLYDHLMTLVSAKNAEATNESDYMENLEEVFLEFPDNHKEMREQGLAYYRYIVSPNVSSKDKDVLSIQQLIEEGDLNITPIIYEDFLPISAAGIFNSNLMGASASSTSLQIKQNPNQASFEMALGASVTDSFSLYEKIQKNSLEVALDTLGVIR
jgi:uncharacterized glyoxalase superfamily metalloenzyme YdcJ